MSKQLFLLLLLLFSFSISNAQFDLARLEVVHIPKGANQDLAFNRVRAIFNIPTKLNEKTHLITGVDYSLVDVVQVSNLDIDTEPLSDFQTYELNIGITKKLKNNWRFVANIEPGVTTNSARKTSFFKEMQVSGGLIFYKNEKETKNYDLLFGVYYSAFNGFPLPLPFLKYHKIINEHWSYDLGFPKINLEYTFNEKHALKTYATADGFNSNLVETVTVSNGVIERFNIRVLVVGLKYDYTMKNRLELYLTSGYILSSRINFRDSNAEDLIRVSGENAIYLRAGIRIKI